MTRVPSRVCCCLQARDVSAVSTKALFIAAVWVDIFWVLQCLFAFPCVWWGLHVSHWQFYRMALKSSHAYSLVDIFIFYWRWKKITSPCTLHGVCFIKISSHQKLSLLSVLMLDKYLFTVSTSQKWLEIKNAQNKMKPSFITQFDTVQVHKINSIVICLNAVLKWSYIYCFKYKHNLF